MMASRMITVSKRDGSKELFDVSKLACHIVRGLQNSGGGIRDARELAGAILIYLQRTGQKTISSAAVFEMSLKALRRIGMADAAELLELNRSLRIVRRRMLRVCHEDGQVTLWEKSWLAELAGRMWHLSRSTSRFLASQVELKLLSNDRTEVPRQVVLDLLNSQVAQWGLADAVPLEPVE